MKALSNLREPDTVPIDGKMPFLRLQNSYCVGSNAMQYESSETCYSNLVARKLIV